MIEKITFKKDYRCFKKDEEIEFNSKLNIFVGDQGSGKSTLLALLCSFLDKSIPKYWATHIQDFSDIATIKVSDKKEIVYINPEYDCSKSKGYFDDYNFQMSTLWSSHGQSVIAKLSQLSKMTDSIIFVDEPETGLSIKNQILLRELFYKLALVGNQLFVATHCFPIINGPIKLFDMDSRKLVKSSDYLENVASSL